MATEFCPQCGNRRTGAFRFCRSCGFDFDAAPTAPATPALPAAPPMQAPQASQTMNSASAPSSTNLTLLAGISWLVSAGATGFLAYQQWSLGTAFRTDELTTTAAWNAVAAAITLYFAARLIASPSRALLDRSAAWGVLSVASGVVQIAAFTVRSDLFVLAVITAAVAGGLSFVGRQQMPSPVVDTQPRPAAIWGARETETRPGPSWAAPAKPQPAPTLRRTSAERLVIVLIVLALLGGGGLLFLRMRADQILADVASALPTFRSTSAPANVPGMLIAIGETVPLVDTNGAALGSVTVLEATEPRDVFGIPPSSGNRLVAVNVRYEAVSAWTYNLFDWALHDSSARQYEPTGLAPEPALSAGTLSPGNNVEGWVGFEVPESAQVWVDMQAGDGTVVFSVEL